jgi:hypothetical protein
VHEGLVETEEAVAVTHGTAKDPADHIARTGVARQLPIGDGEADRTQVVGDHAHGDVGLLSLPYSFPHCFAKCLDQRLEHIGVVVAALALQHHAQTLEAHAGIHVLRGQVTRNHRPCARTA